MPLKLLINRARRWRWGAFEIRKNRRTKEFRKLFDALPKNTQELATAAFDLFVKNPSHPSLGHHELDDNKRGQHRNGSYAVHVSRRWCAIYVVVEGVNLWYWIGSHEDYNNFTGKK